MIRARVRVKVTFADDDLVLWEDLEGQQRREAQPVVGMLGVVSMGLGLGLGL